MNTNWKTRLFGLLFKLTKHCVDKVEIEFSGYGDSGAINKVEYYQQGAEVPANLPLTGEEEEELKDILYDYLETLGHNWYDNDGGNGDITIDVRERKIKCNMHLAHTVYDSYEDQQPLVA